MSKSQISHGTAAQYRWKLRGAQIAYEEEQDVQKKERLMLEIIRYKRLLERPEEETSEEKKEREHWDPVAVNARREKFPYQGKPDIAPDQVVSKSEFALEQLNALAEDERKRKEAKEAWEKAHPTGS